MKNIVHIVHNIPEEDLIDIVDEVFEDVNFETMIRTHYQRIAIIIAIRMRIRVTRRH